ncbi:YcaO-like family protein [Streptomyces sp. NPDC054904]
MNAWTPQVFAPYPGHPDVLLARVAARSAAFEGTSAADGDRVIVGSAAGHDREQVMRGARGELLERIGNVMAGRAAEAGGEVVATPAELRGMARAVIVPSVRSDSRRLWVRGRTVAGRPVYVAAGSVFLQHRPPPGCAALPSAGSTGLASHTDRRSAARHAAWEVLERDLIRRSWYGLSSLPPRALAAAPAGPLGDLFEAQGLVATAFAVPAPPGAECVVVCLHRPDGTEQTFGARCGPPDTVESLVEKAVYEALMVRWSMSSVVARATWERWRGVGPPRTAVQHALWAYHRQDSLNLWKVAGATSVATRPAPEAAPVDPFDVLAGHTGRDVVLVETDGGPARDAGVSVVRVVAPGALPLPPGPPTAGFEPASSHAHPHPHPFG